MTLKMKPRTDGVPRAQRTATVHGEGANWVLIAGGALLSTFSIRLGYKLKQAFDTKQDKYSTNGNENSTDKKKLGSCRAHSNVYSFTQDENSCFNCISGNHGVVDHLNHHTNGQIISEVGVPLPLVTVTSPIYNKENNGSWSLGPDHLELPPKLFPHSNCSDSPSVSESGSDIFIKREVVQKLRHQLKKRDDMIREMQDQILELQNSLNCHLPHASRSQSQLEAVNQDLLREIQRLREINADHSVIQVRTTPIWPSQGVNGYANGHAYHDRENNEEFEKGRGDGERIDMLRMEVRELREVIEGKDYLLQNYKEQKTELSTKILELQQRLDSQLPNIL